MKLFKVNEESGVINFRPDEDHDINFTFEFFNDALKDEFKELIELLESMEESEGACKCKTVVESEKQKECPVTIDVLPEDTNIKVIPLSESENNENVWYVDSFESIEGACSTSKVIFKGDTHLMNVCESEGRSVVSIPVKMTGKVVETKFLLELSCNNEESYDMIVSL